MNKNTYTLHGKRNCYSVCTRFKEWGGVPNEAPQSVKDPRSSPEIESILENSGFICLLNQASGDQKILAERLGIST